MGKINSRTKGSKNERDVAKWWQEFTGFEFGRVPSSGGLRWNRTTDTTGDIICTDKKHFLRFTLSIECKSYKGITFNDIIKGTKSDVLKFWEQAKSDANRGEKIPILFMRENGMSKGLYYVVMSHDVFSIIFKLYCNKFIKGLPKQLRIYSNQEYIFCISSDDLKQIDYTDFHKELRKLRKTKKK